MCPRLKTDIYACSLVSWTDRDWLSDGTVEQLRSSLYTHMQLNFAVYYSGPFPRMRNTTGNEFCFVVNYRFPTRILPRSQLTHSTSYSYPIELRTFVQGKLSKIVVF